MSLVPLSELAIGDHFRSQHSTHGGCVCILKVTSHVRVGVIASSVCTCGKWRHLDPLTWWSDTVVESLDFDTAMQRIEEDA
jgi:hypothetical protein